MTNRYAMPDAPQMIVGLVVVITFVAAGLPGGAQQKGEWPGITGGDTSTRYSTLDQINASNFNTLKVAWEWRRRTAPASTSADINARSLPIYVDGMLITTSGPRRTVVSLDPATGKTLWTFQEPMTPRHEYSMRSNHGKGVAYARINGRGVVFVTTPGFFLHALDARPGGRSKTGAGRCRCWLSEDRIGGSAEGPDRRTGSRGTKPKQPYDRNAGHAAEDRLHHHLVTAHRRQRRPGRRQFGRAGLQPDAAARTCRATSSPTTRKTGKYPVEVPRDSAAGRIRPRDVGERRMAVDRRRLVVGADVGRSGSAGSSTSRPTAPRSTTTVASGPATTCSARASSRST